jgi:hypothetical protein
MQFSKPPSRPRHAPEHCIALPLLQRVIAAGIIQHTEVFDVLLAPGIVFTTGAQEVYTAF